MKKILIILVMLFWCNVGLAMSQQQAIDKHLSERKLNSLEGVWSIVETGQIVLFFKTGNTYQFYDLTYPRYDPGRFEKGSDNYYYGRGAVFYGYDWDNPIFGNQTISISGNSAYMNLVIPNQQQPIKWSMQRIWPTDLASYNAKFKTKEDKQEEEKVLSAMVNDAKKTCKVLGFEDGSEKFADCTLKLYTQKVDELVAERVAANNRMTQGQTSTTTQSSGSNSVTIYDPVRDSRALMKQGQKMLSGACTHGIDC